MTQAVKRDTNVEQAVLYISPTTEHFLPKIVCHERKNVTQLKTHIRTNTEQICVTVPRFSPILYRTTHKIHSKILKCSIYRYYRQFIHSINMIQSNTSKIDKNLVSK